MTASTLLVVVLVASLLALDHPIAHARHLKALKTNNSVKMKEDTMLLEESSMPTGDSSTKKGSQRITKLDVEKAKKIETVEVKGSRGRGAHHSVGSNFGLEGSLSVKFAKAVVDHHGPKPHPPKHN